VGTAPVDAEQIDVARRAWRLFGEGRHTASLSHGDGFAYALALVSGETLGARAAAQRLAATPGLRERPAAAPLHPC
jgi:uncharacterized protein with PIN domain